MKKTLLTTLIIILTVTIGAQVANAIGSLTPSGTAGDDTQYSLNDIYDKLTSFSDTPTSTSSPFTVPGSQTASFRTLSEIYDLMTAENSDLVAGKIATGTTIFGVVGTMVAAPGEPVWSTIQDSATLDIATSTCAGTVDGSTGWRLPTYSELANGYTTNAFPSSDQLWTSSKERDGEEYTKIDFSYHGYAVTDGWDEPSKFICIK